MKTFKDIKFKPHYIDANGKHGLILFDNGYGASIVTFKIMGNTFGSRTHSYDEYELGVVTHSDGEWSLTYDTPITGDVLGYLNEWQVTQILKAIQNLKPKSP